MAWEFNIGVTMLTVYDADGFLGMQYDAEGEGRSGVAPYEGHHMYGFMGRHLDPVVDSKGNPDPTQAAQQLWAMDGGKGHAFALEDPRIVVKLPIIKPGESMMYAAAGQFFRLLQDGSFTMMTTDTGGGPGNSVTFDFGPAGLIINAPWGKLTFDATGFHVLTSSGARIDLGAIGGIPAPFDALASYASLGAAIANINGAMVAIGPAEGPAFPAAQATPLLVFLASMVAALNAITAILGVGAASGPAGLSPASPAIAVLANLVAALGTPPPIGSTTAVA